MKLNFKSIKLNEKEAMQANKIINQLASKNISEGARDSAYKALAEIFMPHLDKEAKIKSKFYVYI